jgi:hypothetical protein
MEQKDPQSRKIVPFNTNVFQDVINRVKLILRLMGDSRVSPWLKLIPLGSLVYFIWPIDIPTPIDDVALVWLASYMFVEMCPPDVVQEHLENLNRTIPGRVVKEVKTPDEPADEPSGPVEGEVIEGDFREEK